MCGLEEDGLLVRGALVKGRVGQPSVPMHLAADGAFSIGLKIGRRRADLALMNFVGDVQEQYCEAFPYPMPTQILDFATDGIGRLLSNLAPASRDRIAGIGIATPFELWNWAEEVGAPRELMEQRHGIDLAKALEHRCGLPIFVVENQLRAVGRDPSSLWLSPEDWTGFGDFLDRWIEHTSQSLAHVIVASCSVIDFPTAIIDGGFPDHVRQAIVAAIQKAVTKLDLQGIQPPDVFKGLIGANARVIGGTALPFIARYLVDQNVLLKEPV